MHHHSLQMAIIVAITFMALCVFGLDSSPQLVLHDLDMGLGRTDDLNQLAGSPDLILLPNALEFPRTPLHSPASHAITLFNNHPNKSVYLNSVTAVPSDTLYNDFHVSFVRDQAVPPQGNVTITVIFLATRLGPVNTELLVRTNFGQLKYQVTGVGVVSPFKVVPLTHLVSYAGLNSSSITIPDISLYNPYSAAIQITEIFSSGGKFYLELPTEDDVDRPLLWTIEPYQRKAVIRVRFTGSAEPGNYSAYIRLKFASTLIDLDESVLVIPIHMEVREAPPITLYPERSLINLGPVLLSEKNRPLHINLYQSHTQEFDIQLESMDLETELSIGEAITRFQRVLDCNNIVVGEELLIRFKIECDLDWTDVIRNVSKSWEAFVPGAVLQVAGGVTVNSTVRSKKSSTIHRIPFFAELISGSGVELPPNVTVFFPKNDEITIGLFYLRNNFDSPVVVAGIHVDWKTNEMNHHPVEGIVEEHFNSIRDDFPRVLKPGESYTMASVTLPMERRKGELWGGFTAHINIQTNVTRMLTIPLYGYSGKLRRLLLHHNFKSIIEAAKGSPNDSEIVTELDAKAINLGVSELGVETYQFFALWNDNPMPIIISSWHTPSFNIPMAAVYMYGCGRKYELEFPPLPKIIVLPGDWCLFKFSTRAQTKGDFKGVIQYDTSYEVSELPISLVVDSGVLFVPDSSLVIRNCLPKQICSLDFQIFSTHSNVVRIKEVIVVPTLEFEQYTDEIQPNTFTTLGRFNMNTASLALYSNLCPAHIFDYVDQAGVEFLVERYLIIFRMYEEQKVACKIVTELNTMDVVLTPEYVWPKFINHSQVKEMVAVHGQAQRFNITIHNPLEESISYWYYLDHTPKHYLSNVILAPIPPDHMNRLYAAKVVHVGEYSGQEKLILGPGETRNLTVFVKGEVSGSYSTVFLLKNNLTYLEGAWLGITIVAPQFKFGNRKPSSTTPLLFETPEALIACSMTHRSLVAHLSTKRVFTAKNTGSVPITITGMSINSDNCSGNGFVILNCAPFRLNPNETHKVEISFMPDFTTSRIERKLIFTMDTNYPLTYNLVGVTPAKIIQPCADILIRPWWEEMIKKWAVPVMVTMAIIVTTFAFFESMTILRHHSEATYRPRGPFQPPLDFKKLTAMKSSTAADNGNDSEKSATKETPKPPKTKTSSNLFVNKRFSWFIKRSQGDLVTEAPSSAIANSNPTNTNSGDKRPTKTPNKLADKPSPSASSSSQPPAPSVASTSMIEAIPNSETKKVLITTSNSGQQTKKDNVSAKKSKVKSKSSKSIEIEPKVKITGKVEDIDSDTTTHNKQDVSVAHDKVTPLNEPVFFPKESPMSGITHGKTPGRERKEKQVQAKRIPPESVNKMALFNNPTANSETPTDPWTNACRGLFQGNGDPSSIATPGGLPYEEPKFPQQQQISQNMHYRQDTMDAINGHSQNPSLMMTDEGKENDCSENPLGAIGTPIAKNHANYLLAMQLQEQQNSYLNSSMFYNDGFDQHVPYPNQNAFQGSHGMDDPYNNFNMDSMYSNHFGGNNVLQGLYAEYQKQQLEQLALLQRLAQHQQQQQQQNRHVNNSNNPTPMQDYTSWDLRQDQWRAQWNQEQGRQSVEQPFNRTTGLPPGLNVRVADGQPQNRQDDSSQQDTSNQYDPLRSIWNGWNGNGNNQQ